MEFITTAIDGVWLIRPRRHGDARGYFAETFRQDLFSAHIGPVHFLQDNESLSGYGTVRGLHMQRGVWSQAKLVRVPVGEVLDVVVDLRPGSPTYGRTVTALLSADNGMQLYVPRGFAHGFAVLSPQALFQYKVDNAYMPAEELTLAYDDPALGIDWRVPPEARLLSDKDRRGIPLSALNPQYECYGI